MTEAKYIYPISFMRLSTQTDWIGSFQLNSLKKVPYSVKRVSV